MLTYLRANTSPGNQDVNLNNWQEQPIATMQLDQSAPSAAAGANIGDGFDFDFVRGIGQCRHLHQGRGGEAAVEKLAPRLPYVFALGDLGDKDRQVCDVGHRTAGGFDEVAGLGKDRLRLGVFVTELGAAAGDHPGDVCDPAGDRALLSARGASLAAVARRRRRKSRARS